MLTRRPQFESASHIALFALAAGMCTVSGVWASNNPRIVNIGDLPQHEGSMVYAVSDDGSAAAGQSLKHHLPSVFRWTATGGIENLGSIPECRPAATAMSADGSLVAGFCGGFEDLRPILWSAATGMMSLPFPGGLETNTAVKAMTPDGSVLVGFSQWSVFWTEQEAARWVQGRNGWVLEQLGKPSGAWLAAANGVSADGEVLVGQAIGQFGGVQHHTRAWRWTVQEGFELLPILPAATSCTAEAISGNSQVITGTCGGRPFIWTVGGGTQELPLLPNWTGASIWGANHDGTVIVGSASTTLGPSRAAMWTSAGPKDIEEELAELGVNLAGWSRLWLATAVNAAGDVIAGSGEFEGQTRGWVAHLSGCYANCDGSTTFPILNVDDFTCFIDRFAAAQQLPHEAQVLHYANCDNSTTAPVLNVDDFTCFIAAFAAGCP